MLIDAISTEISYTSSRQAHDVNATSDRRRCEVDTTLFEGCVTAGILLSVSRVCCVKA